MSFRICLSSGELNLRVCEVSGEEILTSQNDMSELGDVIIVKVERIIGSFRIRCEIHIIELHITWPFQNMVQTQSFTNINRMNNIETDCFGEHKSTVVISHTNAYIGYVLTN